MGIRWKSRSAPRVRCSTSLRVITCLILFAGLAAAGLNVPVHADGVTARVDVSSTGIPGNGYGSTARSFLSADGRYVTFTSAANNLVSADTNDKPDVFVRDLLTGETTRVTVSSSGVEGSGHSSGGSISADGRFVSFTSYSSDLVSGDTNGKSDVFVHDRAVGETARVSLSSVGGQGNGDNYLPIISADGRYVAFTSFASNLVTGDTNGASDVFVHDRQTGETERVSVLSGGAQLNGHSSYPSISADGRYVSFMWDANVYVHDRQLGETTLVSVSNSGEPGNALSMMSDISADGRYVAFESDASNLVSGDVNLSRDVFVRDLLENETTIVSVSSEGAIGSGYPPGEMGSASSFHPSISDDGRYITFSSFAKNFSDYSAGPSEWGWTADIYTHDRLTGQTVRITDPYFCPCYDGYSVYMALQEMYYYHSSVNATGERITFYTDAPQLPGETYFYGAWKIYVHEPSSGSEDSLEISVDSPSDNFLTNQPQGTITGALSRSADLTIDGESVALGSGNAFSHAVIFHEGVNVIELVADDGLETARLTLTVILDTVAPDAADSGMIDATLPVDGQVTVSGAEGSVESGSLVRITNQRTGASIVVLANAAGAFSAVLYGHPGDSYTIDAIDEAGNESSPSIFSQAGMPPNPVTTAPPLNPRASVSFLDAVRFLYSGAQPVQTGVVSGVIEAKRAAVLRGSVKERNGQPLPGVTITIHDRNEYGQTRSRADGHFDLVVNGGGALTVQYHKSGYLPVQRTMDTPWEDYAWLPDVVMIPLDTQVTAIDLTSALPMQIARGSVATDELGSRQATLLFPQGTSAQMILPDGTSQALGALNVRATEYTVGATGPQAMPGILPSPTAYTYAVEFSVDEAIVAGAERVNFSQMVPFYVENVRQFPAGAIVPVGWYDRARAAWIPSDNGRVIEILSVAGGLADIDVDGSGVAADAEALGELGITDAERAQLAVLYAPGVSLFRSPITHFTPFDCNFPWGPPADASNPPLSPRDDPVPDEEQDVCAGCVIQPQSQSLGESIPVAGTPYRIHYQSKRMPGYTAKNSVRIPVTGESVPGSLLSVEVTIQVAGRLFRQTFMPAPNQQYTFMWDGNDAFGRPLGAANAHVTLDYLYRMIYVGPNQGPRAFGRLMTDDPELILGAFSTDPVRMRRQWVRPLVASPSLLSQLGLGGWSLDAHHSYDPLVQTLWLGDGARRVVSDIGPMIVTIAGGGSSNGDGGVAGAARLSFPSDVIAGPDGSLYIADRTAHRIRRVGADGVITTIAGTGAAGFSGDGGPAVSAQLRSPSGIALAPDGALFIADTDNHRIRKIDRSGVIGTVAGTGASGFSGMEGLAESMQLSFPTAVSAGKDGIVYVADTGNDLIRQLDQDGYMTTLAGTGVGGFSGDGGPARSARLRDPSGVIAAADGSVYI